MTMGPSVTVASVDEPITDAVGQQWSPATIAVAWPSTSGPTAELEAPSIQIRVLAPYRPNMTVEELRQAHLRAALNVLSSALLALEESAPDPQGVLPTPRSA
jgi:hypothetical protein